MDEKLTWGHISALEHINETLHHNVLMLDVATTLRTLADHMLLTAEIVRLKSLLVLLISDIPAVLIFVKDVQ